jgi:hypothetical protein
MTLRGACICVVSGSTRCCQGPLVHAGLELCGLACKGLLRSSQVPGVMQDMTVRRCRSGTFRYDVTTVDGYVQARATSVPLRHQNQKYMFDNVQ